MGFGGEDQGGIYHSIYDDFYWYTHFSDKDFVYGRALAQTAGTTVMRLADADVLPLDFDNFTDTLRRYIDEVQKLARDKRDQIVERNRQIDDGVFALIDDPRRPRTVPPREAVPPFLNFAPLENGFAALQRTARAYDEALAHAAENGGDALARASLREVNARLIAIERAMTLQRRTAQSRLVQAPDLRAGILHRLRREDAAGGAREHRAEGLEAGRGTDRARRQGAGEHRRGDSGRHRGTDARGAVRRSALARAFQMLIQMSQAGELSGELRGARRTRRASRAEIAAAEEIALRDYRRAHRTVFVSALRPG